jgi:hypothetical protein
VTRAHVTGGRITSEPFLSLGFAGGVMRPASVSPPRGELGVKTSGLDRPLESALGCPCAVNSPSRGRTALQVAYPLGQVER